MPKLTFTFFDEKEDNDNTKSKSRSGGKNEVVAHLNPLNKISCQNKHTTIEVFNLL